MITLALDEFGDFENRKPEENKPIGVAGIIYDDNGNKEDTLLERKRIKAYYSACIAEIRESKKNENIVYPDALHADRDSKRNSEVVGPTKRKVNASLREFLNFGTFDGKELLGKNSARSGKYYLFLILKSTPGMKALLNERTNFLVNDEKGSNLYFHMATEVVNRMLFHNPVIDNVREISVNIATRRTNDLPGNSLDAAEYIQLGYIPQSSINNEDVVNFNVANADIYRSVISREMLEIGKAYLSIEDFLVTPISYNKNKRNMEFLYLADSICTFLSNHIAGENAEEWLPKIVAKAATISNKDNNLIFGYDEIDMLFRKAWSAYEEGNYYEALRLSYSAKLKKGAFAQYYYDRWFKLLIDKIISESSERNFIDAVNRLHGTIMTNTYEQDSTVFILEALEKKVPAITDKLDDAEARSILYKLYDSGVSAYCHIGDSKHALSYYNKCKKYANRVSVEEYLVTLNKMSETLIDCFEWQKAMKIADESIKYQEQLLVMRNALPIYAVENQSSSVGLSKAYSQKGQVCAFLRKPDAATWFKKALDGMEKQSADYKITQSYLLHYYLDNGKVEEYKEESADYFGNEKSPAKQLDYILTEGFQVTPIINYKYALYVFVRGLWVTKPGNISESLRKKLYVLNATVKKAEKKVKSAKNVSLDCISGHPLELIYKYIYLIASENGDTEYLEEIYESLHNCLGYRSDTLDSIIEFGDIQIAKETGNSEKADGMASVLLTGMINKYESLRSLKSSDADTNFVELEKLFTFMFN